MSPNQRVGKMEKNAELSHGGRIKPLLNYCGKRVLPH